MAPQHQDSRDPAGAVGLRLRRRREQLGLTGVEVARRAGVAHSHISQVENGRLQPTPDFLFRVVPALWPVEHAPRV